MKLLLFEWLTGGGLWVDGHLPELATPLLNQGRSMLKALAQDAIEHGHLVNLIIDERIELPERRDQTSIRIGSESSLDESLTEAASRVDAILFVAPESNRRLEYLGNLLYPWNDKWLCPDMNFVELTSDKTQACDYLNLRGVPTATGQLLQQLLNEHSLRSFPTPAVIKPNRGAGSEHCQVVNHWDDVEVPAAAKQWRVERFVHGLPVSVAVVANQTGNKIFRPMGQVFDGDPIGHYVGSTFPLKANIEHRAFRLARRTVEALPTTNGYFGIDMVIAPDESQDVVIEINPRITMSYERVVDQNGAGPANLIFGKSSMRNNSELH